MKNKEEIGETSEVSSYQLQGSALESTEMETMKENASIK